MVAVSCVQTLKRLFSTNIAILCKIVLFYSISFPLCSLTIFCFKQSSVAYWGNVRLECHSVIATVLIGAFVLKYDMRKLIDILFLPFDHFRIIKISNH